MADVQFSCEACPRTMSIGTDFSGRRVECPDCGTLTAVPGFRMAPLRSVGPKEALGSSGGLEIEITFPCTWCDAHLIADFDLLGRLIDCPACHHMVQVPRWSVPDVHLKVSVLPAVPPQIRLSPEEIAFLSGEEIAS